MKKISPCRIFIVLFALVCGYTANLVTGAGAASEVNNSLPKKNPTDFIDAGHINFRVFTDQNGLPQNTPQAMTFDSKGYLWIGTQDGAAYFNGHLWKIVNMPDRNVSNFIKAILASKDGSIWFGRDIGGVSILKDGNWTTFNDKSGLPSNNINALLEATEKDGTTNIWVATEKGLARFQKEEWTVFNTDNTPLLSGNEINSLLETKTDDGNSVLWVGTSKGLVRFQNDRWETINLPSDSIGSFINTLYETRDDDGTRVLWIGTSKALVRLKNENLTIVDEKDGIAKKNIRCFAETKSPDGTRSLWIGTDGRGLLRYEKGNWTVFNTNTGLPSNSIFSLMTHSIGEWTETLWIGSDGNGLAQMKQGQWITFDSTNGLPTSSVFSVYEMIDANNERSLWIGTYGGGLARLKNGAWKIFDTSDGLPDNTIFETKEITDENGERSLWIGTKGGGLVQFKDERIIPFGKETGFPGGSIRQFLETTDSDGSKVVWCATGRGLGKYKNGKWTLLTTADGLPDINIFEIAETISQSGEKTLWVATGGGGLAAYKNGGWQVFTRDSGLGNNFILSLHVSSHSNGKQTLWAGTQNGGASYLDLSDVNAKWKTISDMTNPAIPNNTIYQVQEDKKGRIYLFTNKGVSRLTPRIPTEDNAAEFDIKTFTTEDGLPSNEHNGGVSMVDSKGRIWGGTVSGAAVFDPSKEVEDKTAKPLYIENIFLNDTEVKLKPNTSLAYNQSNITFVFALLSYSHTEATLYRSQLEGLEDSPSAWTHEYRRTFTTLPAGSYVFKLWGKDYAGNISGPVEIPFTIKPPFWRTWWAYAIYTLLFGGLIYAGIRYRLRSLNQHNAELQEKIDERTKELAEKVEQLKTSERRAYELAQAKSQFLANMSHEIRTPMNGMLGMTGLMLDTQLTQKQREYTEIISRSGDALLTIIDDILDFSKIEAGKLRLENVDFDFLTVVEDVLELLATRAHIKGIEVLSLIKRDVPQMVKGDPARVRQIFTNLVSNAIKFTEKGQVVLRAELVSETEKDLVLHCEIEDTGIGISKEALGKLFEPFTQADTSTTRKYGGTGLGLAISKQLVELMNGEIGVKSEVGEGSTFWFSIKFEKSGAQVYEPVDMKDLQHSKVLIVTSNGTLAESLKQRLASWNVIALSVSNEKEMFDLLRDEPSLDALIIDSRFGETDWQSIVNEIQSFSFFSDVPLVVMQPLGAHLEKTGAIRFLAKPVRRTQLARALHAAIFRTFGDIEEQPDFVGEIELEEKQTSNYSARSKSKRILVVEDNFVNRTVITEILYKLGYAAEAVTDGKMAVERMRFELFDLVLMDCHMPEMDGFEATRQIRIDEGTTRHTPIIALTASALPDERARCFEAGMDDFMSKPVKQDEFEASLARWLKHAPQPKRTHEETYEPIITEDDSNGFADVIDKKALNQLLSLQSAGNPNLFKELFDGFVSGTEERLSKLREAIEREDNKEVKVLAHTIKGACYQFGAFRVSEFSDKLESEADSMSTGEQKDLTEQIEKEFELAKRTIEAFQAKK